MKTMRSQVDVECVEDLNRLPDLMERALKLYHPPFRYEMGRVYDARSELVLDEVALAAEGDVRAPAGSVTDYNMSEVLRIRGWGRICYLPDAPELQDEVGRLVAKSLTESWRRWLRELAPAGAGHLPEPR